MSLLTHLSEWAVDPLFQARSDLASAAVNTAKSFVLNQPDTLGDGDCEALHPGFFSQPVNTVTSMAYAVGGAWVAARTASVKPEHRLGSGSFAALMILNGVGSVAYHGPQFPGAQALHDLPAVGIAVTAAAVPLWRLLRHRRPLPGWSNTRIAAITGIGALAAVSYVEGRTASNVCDPDSWMQFHGLWHLSTAAAMVAISYLLWPNAEQSPDLAAQPAGDAAQSPDLAAQPAGDAEQGHDDEEVG